MIDAIKKTLLAGVGAAVITKEKVEAALGDFVKEGKMSAAEARAMAEKIAAQGRQEFETFSRDLNDRFKETFSGSERKFSERIAALEARLAALEKEAGKPRARRTSKPSEPA